MQMNHAAFESSPALRVSLKRGLSRQAVEAAARTAPDLPQLFRQASELRPNRKALERVARRIKVRSGVVRVALSADGKALVFVTRAAREIKACVEGEEVFRETGLIYLRARVGIDGDDLTFRLSAVGFCGHALERLVERSTLRLDQPLIPALDTEAIQIFRSWDTARLIVDAGDEYYRAATSGLWAGGYDRMAMDDDWNLLSRDDMTLPIFSARTFLSEAEMRPTLWLRWKDDPGCRMA
ncbi:MAG: hypothetical protein H6903_13445 [Rhodobacteraceae bacterium]|nr:hypothetical protein [Paracoccaceae bacterium]